MAIREVPRIIYNDDTCSLRYIDAPHTLDKLVSAHGYLKNTQVDWIMWCITDDLAYSYYSKQIDNYFDLIDKLDPAESVGRTKHEDLMYNLYQQGIDYVPHLIERFHQQNQGFFASFRMNDCHHKSNPQGPLASEFWKKSQHMRLWDVEDAASYYNAALDYSYKEVRDRRFVSIKEVVEWYDVDGVELDFKRNNFTFPKGTGWQQRRLLTGLYRRVRRLLDRVGKTRGRKLKLITKIPAGEERRRACGMDVEAWLKQGLVDVIVISDHANDLNLDFVDIRDLTHKHGGLFYNSLEADLQLSNRGRSNIWLPRTVTPPMHNDGVQDRSMTLVTRDRAYAQNCLAQGADGVYLFNFPCILFEQKPGSAEFRLLTDQLLNELGSRKTLRGLAKEYCYWSELPLYVESLRPAEHCQTVRFKLYDADIRGSGRKVKLSWRQIAEMNPHAVYEEAEHSSKVPKGHMQVRLNGKLLDEQEFSTQAQPAGLIPSKFIIGEHDRITVDLDSSLFRYGENTLAFEVPSFPKKLDPYIYIYELVVTVSGD